MIRQSVLNESVEDDPTMRHPVYITDEEDARRNHIEKQTKEVIANLIEQAVQQIPDDQTRNYYSNHFTSKIKGKASKVRSDIG